VHIDKNISVNVPELAKRLFFICSPKKSLTSRKEKNIYIYIYLHENKISTHPNPSMSTYTPCPTFPPIPSHMLILIHLPSKSSNEEGGKDQTIKLNTTK